MKHICGHCKYKYFFREYDKEWYTAQTICPRCTFSLGAQESCEEIRNKLKESQSLGGGLYCYQGKQILDSKKFSTSYVKC